MTWPRRKPGAATKCHRMSHTASGCGRLDLGTRTRPQTRGWSKEAGRSSTEAQFPGSAPACPPACPGPSVLPRAGLLTRPRWCPTQGGDGDVCLRGRVYECEGSMRACGSPSRSWGSPGVRSPGGRERASESRGVCVHASLCQARACVAVCVTHQSVH